MQASHPPLDAQGPPTTIEAVPASPERAAVVSSVNIHPPGAVKHGSVLITGLFFRKSGAEAQHLCLQEAWALGSPVEATGVLLGNRKFLTQLPGTLGPRTKCCPLHPPKPRTGL